MEDHRNSAERAAARPSTTGLVGDAFEQVTGLVRGEINLARAEVQESANKAAAAVGMLVGAVVLLLVALNVLAAALVAWLTETGMDAGWAALIVGGVLALVGAIMAFKGQSDLKASSLAPSRTMTSVRKDAETVKEATTHGR